MNRIASTIAQPMIGYAKPAIRVNAATKRVASIVGRVGLLAMLVCGLMVVGHIL